MNDPWRRSPSYREVAAGTRLVDTDTRVGNLERRPSGGGGVGWEDVETTFTDVIMSVGELTLRYAMGDLFAFPTPPTQAVARALKDTSGFPLPVGSVPHNLDYIERNTAVGWSAANRPTLQDVGPIDPCVHFNFLQTGNGSLANGTPQPGAYFTGGTNGLSSWEPAGGGAANAQPIGKEMHTFVWFFSTDGDAPAGQLFSNVQGILFVGFGGWGISQNPASGGDTINFACTQAGFQPSVSLISPVISRNSWHMGAITRDVSTSPATWKMWIDAVIVATITSPYVDHGYNDFTAHLTIGNGDVNDLFYKGKIDEVLCYSSLLTQTHLTAIKKAAGL